MSDVAEHTAARTAPIFAMPGTMMDVQLNIRMIFEHALRNSPWAEIVTRLDDGTHHRYTYADFGRRVARLANALVRLGIRPGDRVASFAWNTYRHVELYYAVPMIGAVLHTTNIRLFPEQVIWAFEHAEDKLVFVDASLVPVAEKAVATTPGFATPFVAMGGSGGSLPGALDYEELLAAEPDTFDWPEIDERSAATLCYTSATTGDPKGVVFTHRSQTLHAMIAGQQAALGMRQSDSVLPVVPMFHVNAWGVPYLAPMLGAKLVMPGSKLDPASVIDLVDREGVTLALGVPTVWLAVRDELERRDAYLPTLSTLVIGGAACPPSLFDDLKRRGIDTIHSWGMTEMSPIGTNARPISQFAALDETARRAELLKQGRFVPLVAWKVLGPGGAEVPHDGATSGALWVRGPAVTGSYYKLDVPPEGAFEDGWFHTGDVATVDALGFMNIVDRSKDLVKSGGEWISSVDLENALMGHHAVREAAVIAVPHPRWQERPVAVVALREGHAVEESALQAWLGERVAKWWVPDRIVVVEAIPRTGVGKFLKRDLRTTYAELLTGPATDRA